MTRPLVSIHLMTFNQADFIAQTIESALNQTYPNLQIVIGDDGSSDGADQIIAAYAEAHPDKIKLVGEGVHVGIHANANRILKACDGELIAILNGDDLFAPTKIEQQVRWFEQHPDGVLCGHDTAYFEDDPTKPYKLQSDVGPMRAGRGAEDFLRHGVPFATVSVMIRASAMPEYGFDPQLRTCLDWKMWVDCLSHGGQFGYVEGVLASYRVHQRNSTATMSGQIWLDAFAGLGLVEARNPELAGACQAARARRFYQRGVAAHQRGQRAEARQALLTALRYDPLLSWKVYSWLAINEAPPMSQTLITRARALARRVTRPG